MRHVVFYWKIWNDFSESEESYSKATKNIVYIVKAVCLNLPPKMYDI